MSKKQKEYLVDQIFKVGSVLRETEAWLQSVYSFLRTKYHGINVDLFNGTWRQFSIDAYLGKLKNIYTSNFTEDELQIILNFWVSPVGHKITDIHFTSVCRQFAIDWATQVEQALQRFVKQEPLSNSQEVQSGVKE